MANNDTTLLSDDAPDHVLEATALQERRDAFHGAVSWKGAPLTWTASRAGLYDFLRIPAPVLSEAALAAIRAAKATEGTAEAAALQDRANALFAAETGGSTGHVRNAGIILWLAAHQPKDWRAVAHDKGRMLEIIDDWIDANVSPGEIGEVADTTNKLLAQADATRAVSRPQRPNPDEEGN